MDRHTATRRLQHPAAGSSYATLRSCRANRWRAAYQKRWASRNPEAAARAESLVPQHEAAVEDLRADLARAESSGNARKAADAQAALDARLQWLEQSRAGVKEFTR